MDWKLEEDKRQEAKMTRGQMLKKGGNDRQGIICSDIKLQTANDNMLYKYKRILHSL